MDKNSFLELVFNPICRMSEVNRYSGIYQETVENLAEHVADVTIISYIIANRLKKLGEDIDTGILLEKCLLHDVEEVITGDIPRTTKYATGKIRKGLEELAVKSAASLLTPEQYDLWSKAKDGKEGFILKVADFLVVAKKCIIEIEIRNNYSFLKVLHNVLLYFLDKVVISSQFKQESVAYLEKLWDDTIDELTDTYDKYSDMIVKYKLDNGRIDEL